MKSGLGILMMIAGVALLAFAGFQFIQAATPNTPPVAPPTLVAIEPATPVVMPTRAVATPTVDTPTAAAEIASDTPAPVELPTLAPIPAGTPTPLVTRPKGARILIPAIHVDAPVVEMGWEPVQENGQTVNEWQVPDNAVGHILTSANPGERGNVVMSAHNNLYAAIFRKLYPLKPGDEITVFNAAGQGFLYRVSLSYLVQEAGASYAQRVENARAMLPTTDARLTLISCYPETSNTHRAIVIAALIGAAE